MHSVENCAPESPKTRNREPSKHCTGMRGLKLGNQRPSKLLFSSLDVRKGTVYDLKPVFASLLTLNYKANAWVTAEGWTWQVELTDSISKNIIMFWDEYHAQIFPLFPREQVQRLPAYNPSLGWRILISLLPYYPVVLIIFSGAAYEEIHEAGPWENGSKWTDINRCDTLSLVVAARAIGARIAKQGLLWQSKLFLSPLSFLSFSSFLLFFHIYD